jgi:hypothetical protein
VPAFASTAGAEVESSKLGPRTRAVIMTAMTPQMVNFRMVFFPKIFKPGSQMVPEL